MLEIIDKFKVLNKFKKEFLKEIKLLYVLNILENNVLIVTNNDKVFTKNIFEIPILVIATFPLKIKS
jgi:hypothetical protein